jgi:spermidine synthase
MDLARRKSLMKSAYPCTDMLTLGPWIYLVPQFHPESVLILGYGDGTVAGLIRKLYGDVKITGVDIEIPKHRDSYTEFVLSDARDFLKRLDPNYLPQYHQVIIIDLFVEQDICQFVFEKEFADLVTSKCDYLIIHADYNSDMSHYEHLYKVRTLELTTHRFHYFLLTRVIKGFAFHA